MSNTPLRFDPDSELTFNEDKSTVLSVSNENSQIVVCKIHTTVENCYKINPSYFFLPSLEKVVVQIEINGNVDDDDYSDHEFTVSWLPIGEKDLPKHAEDYWKQNLKSRRKDIISRNFGCEFKKQCLQTVHNIEKNVTSNPMLNASEIDENIEHLGKIAMDSHTTVAKLNSEFDFLLQTMETAGTHQLNEIIKTLHEISIDYKHLEHKTRSAVNRTAYAVSEVACTASSKKLKPQEKIMLMKRDFASLSNEFDTLSKHHTDIGEKLATQAEKAEATKEENDRRVKKAEVMKGNAKTCGVLGTPGVGLVSSVVAFSEIAAGSVSHPAVKVLVGIGGAIGGAVVGTVITAGSPILLGIAAVLAVKSKVWSVKFENMHDMIRQLEKIMDQAAQHLSDIDTNLNALDEQINHVDSNENIRVLDEEFRRIQRVCEKVRDICMKYEQLADSKTTRIKQIEKPKS